jgi:hypothetical protein
MQGCAREFEDETAVGGVDLSFHKGSRCSIASLWGVERALSGERVRGWRASLFNRFECRLVEAKVSSSLSFLHNPRPYTAFDL